MTSPKSKTRVGFADTPVVGRRPLNIYKKIAIISSVSWVMVLSCLIGLGIGYFLDKTLKTLPLFTIIFLLVGTIAGFYEGIQMIITSTKEPPKENT